MAAYTQSRLIYLALLKISAIDVGATPTTNQTDDATDALDDLIKEWQADGLRLWAQEDLTITMTASKSSYSIGPTSADVTNDRPMRVIYGRLHNTSSGDDIPLLQYSRWDYNNLGNKTNTGTPNSFYYDPQIPNGNLYLYNVPDSTAASTYSVILTYQKPVTDITYSTTSLVYPDEWFQALKWGLAAELLTEYGYPLNEGQYIIAKAEYYKRRLEDWDQEQASTRFGLELQR